MKRMRFRYEISHVLIGKILIVLISMISSVYFSRMLQAEGRGELSVIASISGIFIQFCNFGLHSAHIYYVSKDRNQLGVVEGNICIAFLLSLGIAALSYPVMLMHPEMLNLSPTLLFFSMGLFVTNLFLMLQENLFLALGSVTKYNLLQILPPALSVGTVMIASVWCSVDIYLVAALSVAAQLMVMLISLADKALVKPTLSVKYFLSVMPYGMKSYSSCLVTYLLLRADILMLNYFLPKSEVGYYSLAVSITDMLYMVSSSVSTVLFPRLSSSGSLEEKIALMHKVLKVMIPIVLLLSAGIGIFAEIGVHILYGDEFLNSVPLIRWLLIASSAWGIAGFAFNFFASENQFIESIVVPFIAFVVNIVMNYWLIPRMAAYGAVVASDFAYVFVAVSMYFCMHRYIKKRKIL